MSSYITLSDLESLNLSPKSSTTHEGVLVTSLLNRRPTTTLSRGRDDCSPSSSTRSYPDSSKQVSFCPMAALIQVADEGQIEPNMVNRFKRDLGKKQISVRTYELETPNFGNATSRAWNSVRNGLTATLEPLLNTNHAGGVTTTSRRRETSPERESSRQVEYKCPETKKTGRTRTRTASSNSWSTPETSSTRFEPEDEDCQEDSTFIPNEPSRLRLKIPTVKRRCSRPCLLSKTSKSCLRTPSPTIASASLPSSLPVSLSTDPILSTSPPRKPLPTVSTSPLDPIPLLPTSHPQSATLVPVVDCCIGCYEATEYGHEVPESEYVEHWSRGAKKLKAEQDKEKEEREQWLRTSDEIKREYAGEPPRDESASEPRSKFPPSNGQTEPEEENEKWQMLFEEGDDEAQEELIEEALTNSKLGLKARGVDELQLGKSQRHVKTILEKEFADREKEEEEEEEEEEELQESRNMTMRKRGTPRSTPSLEIDVSNDSNLAAGSTIDTTSPRSIDDTSTASEGRDTPLTSPELPPLTSLNDYDDQDKRMSTPTRNLHPSQSPASVNPSISKMTTLGSNRRELRRPAIMNKPRSNSFTDKLASFGSSFFGGSSSNSSVQGVRF